MKEILRTELTNSYNLGRLLSEMSQWAKSLDPEECEVGLENTYIEAVDNKLYMVTYEPDKEINRGMN